VRRHLRGHHAGATDAIAAAGTMTTVVEDIADDDSTSVSESDIL